MYVIILLFLRIDIPKMQFYNASRKDFLNERGKRKRSTVPENDGDAGGKADFGAESSHHRQHAGYKFI